jgi:DNA-binding NtrC family response regulator
MYIIGTLTPSFELSLIIERNIAHLFLFSRIFLLSANNFSSRYSMKSPTAKILIVATDNSLKDQIQRLFKKSAYQFTWLDKIDRLIKYFESKTYDLLLISGEVCKKEGPDYRDLIQIISRESPQTQILMMVRENRMHLVVDALESGGYQYIRLPAPDEELRVILNLTLEKRQEFGQNKLLTVDESVYRFEKFIGGSQEMQTVYKQIQQVAPTGIPVLLLGETGTGKDLAAQAIHRLSSKREGHYFPVNLGAFPSELVASELFGHEKGAFTGANNQHKGVFEVASDGTVFLDEIESIDNKVQISLLRLIEQKKVTRLGGRRSMHTDARIITASNENLEDLVERGIFREDLFFRLDVFRITLPPLRNRIGDIPLIAQELIADFNFELNKNIVRIKPDAMAALDEYEWPGNVRELKNVLQRTVLVCEDEQIGEEHLPIRVQRKTKGTPKLIIEVGTSLDEVEKQLIRKTLSHTKNNRKKAAELLGITRRALYNKLNKHKIL